MKLRDLIDNSRTKYKKQCRKMKKNVFTGIITTDVVTPVFTRSLMLKYWTRCEKIIDSCFEVEDQNAAAAANAAGLNSEDASCNGTKRLEAADSTPARRSSDILSRHLIAVLCVLAETRSTVLELCTYYHQTKKVGFIFCFVVDCLIYWWPSVFCHIHMLIQPLLPVLISGERRSRHQSVPPFLGRQLHCHGEDLQRYVLRLRHPQTWLDPQRHIQRYFFLSGVFLPMCGCLL